MKFPLRAILSTIAVLMVVGCGTKQDMRYLDSQVAEKLEVPPDLTVTNQANDLVLPPNFSSNVDVSKPLETMPVLLNVDSLQLEGQADFHWLSVDAPIDDLFETVKTFWLSEGFLIEVEEPAIGVLQTEWVYQEEGADKSDTNFILKFFLSDNLSATQNQFRTRIERDMETGKARVYIAHRGTAYEHILLTKRAELDGVSRNDWQLMPPNSELEVEMLSRLMIYLGLKQAEVDQQLASAKFFAPLSSIHADYSENETYLLVKDSYSKTWYRTLHQLDRMNIEVLSADFDNVLRTKGEIRVKTNVEEEISEGGFFSFGSKTKVVKKQLIFVLTEESHNITRISMVTPDGDVESSEAGVELITLLHQFLK